MTAPTPVDAISVGAQVLSIRSMAAFHRTNKIDLPLADMLDSHADIITTLGSTLAAATADRDDARRELAEQKRINTSNLRVMTEQLELARQTVSDAPHDGLCNHPESPCRCWKAGL